ncbi:hypothetical protein J4Q44_G00251200 [Coregonus suidteri]|uniref:Uncharacterized protein n=1 Tax=Coregonus suidteri TaxID=861788 RepID=A0AAN8QG55_9TELE
MPSSLWKSHSPAFLSTLANEMSATTVYSEKWARLIPLQENWEVPSGICPLPCVPLGWLPMPLKARSILRVGPRLQYTMKFHSNLHQALEGLQLQPPSSPSPSLDPMSSGELGHCPPGDGDQPGDGWNCGAHEGEGAGDSQQLDQAQGNPDLEAEMGAQDEHSCLETVLWRWQRTLGGQRDAVRRLKADIFTF